MKETHLNKLYLQIASSSGEGMQVEACNPNNKSPLISFSSKIEGEILVEIYNGKENITFPLNELEKAISTAKIEVHSEEFYD